MTVSIPILFGVALRNISPNFGDPRSGGRLHEGEDILAPKGTPIVSPTPAVVLRKVTGPTEGNTIYTANPGGETFVYMHLDRFGEGVDVGDVLETGALIGYVGDTGNALGGPAHLHFEIHDSSRNPVDPYPRITEEIPLSEKILYVEKILEDSSDELELARFLVSNFRSTFISAQNAGVTLSQVILDALSSSVGTQVTTSVATALPAGDLDVGSRGALVVELQNYLIAANLGSTAQSLKQAGATGYFGPVTKAALAEFQRVSSLSPATGYYGAATRAYIAAHPLNSPAVTTTVPASSATTVRKTIFAFTRDLSSGKTGEDVKALQKILNEIGMTVSTSGAGSFGNESTYFGPATQNALIKFQLSRSITPAVGYFGPITRAAFGTI